MSAAPMLAPAPRYATACAFCSDGAPVALHRGKAACERCRDAFLEARGVDTSPIPIPVARLRMLARYLLGLGPREYMAPLYERALRARGSFRP